MTTYAPVPIALGTDELDAIRCAARSGNAATLEETLRLLATVDALQKALVLRAGRIRDAQPTPIQLIQGASE